MKKRITAIITVLLLILAMALPGCGPEPETAQPDVSITAASSAETAPEDSETPAPSEQEKEQGSISVSSGSEEAFPSEASAESSGSDDVSMTEASSEPQQETQQESQQTSSTEPSSAQSSVSSAEITEEPVQAPPEEDGLTVTEDGEYTDKDHVALYIHEYGHLPSNFVTKKKAMEAGWDSRGGNLNTVLPGKSIGGDRFGNYEGLLPEKSGRKYYECDIDFNPDGQTEKPARRNAKRIIYSNDGLVFYTEDHYESFEQLY